MRLNPLRLRTAVMSACLLSLVGCADMDAQYATPSGNGAVVGAIKASGDFQSGAGLYAIDLSLPPGRDDVQPGATLRYSSRAGDGVFGMGWFMNAYNEISRCPATLAADGYTGGVNDSVDDRFCIEDQHLILTGGVYGKSGSTYRTQVDGYDEMQLHGDADQPDSWFVIDYRNGTRSFLKQPFVPQGAKAPLSWDETLYEDQSGETIERRYDLTHPGELLLTDIYYTGHDANGTLTTGTRNLHFDYETRPDVEGFFVAGGALRQTRRVSSIVMNMPADAPATGSREVREYSLSYAQSAATGRSLLSSITECAFDEGKKLCLPATRFSWENEQPVYQKPVAYNLPAPDANLSPLQMIDATSSTVAPYYVNGDFDGDGRRELFYYRPGVGAHLYFLNADGTLRKDVDVGKFFQTATDSRYHGYAADIDNDGALDLPGDVDGQLAFASWNGADMGKPVPTGIPYSQEVSLEDLDGDGLVDVLQAEPVKPGSADHALYFYRNLGSRPGELKFAPRKQIALLRNRKTSGTPDYDSFQTMHGLDNSRVPAIIISSANKIEQIIFLRPGPDGALRLETTTPEAIGMINRPFKERTFIADINGDGLTDIVYSDGPDAKSRTWHYQLNIGGRFAPVVDTHVADERTAGVGEYGTLVSYMDGVGGDEFIYPDKLVTAFCMGSKHSAKGNYTTAGYACSGDSTELPPWNDLGIYQYAVMKFVQSPDGTYTPQVDHDTGIITQANLATLGDLRGDGLTDVISPFSPWFANGRFKDAKGELVSCPADYGCGLHVASPVSAAHKDYANSFPDMMTGATDGVGKKTLWDYYPLSSPKVGLYTVKPVGNPSRFIDPHRFYFDSPMYVVGGYAESSGVGQGFLAYTAQYRDAIFDSSGPGFVGFGMHINTDLSGEIRHVFIYDYAPPMNGSLTSEWKEHTENSADDLTAGKPDPKHGYYLVNTWDCYGPTGAKLPGGSACKPRDGQLYQTRLRHKDDHDYDDKLKSWVDAASDFEYDDYGNVTQSIVTAVSDAKSELTETTYTYLPPDKDAWATDRISTQETRITTTPLGKDVKPGDKTVTDKKQKYEYGARGRVAKETIDEGKPVREVHGLTFQDDPTASDFGRLTAVTISHVNAADATLEDLHTVHISYTPDGYFPISYKTADKDEEINEYDPVTGKETREVKDGNTTVSRFDPFGRVVMQQFIKPEKPELTVNASYVPCDRSCPANAVFMRVDHWSNGSVYTVWFNIRSEEMNDPYK